MTTLYKIAGEYQTRYTEKYSDAENIAKDITALDGGDTHVFTMSVQVSDTPVATATLIGQHTQLLRKA